MSRIRPSLRRPSATMTVIGLTATVVLTGCSSSTSATVPPPAGSSTPGASSTASTQASTKASGGGGGASAGTGFCQKAALAQAAQGKAAGSLSAGDPGALQKIEQQGQKELHALRAVAPSAIRSDVDVLVTADDKLYSALAGANFDMRKVNPSVLSGFDTPAFTKATQAITDYLTKTCGLSVSPSA